MTLFQKNSVPKRLSINDMWQVYKLLGRGRGRQYLLDEIIQMLESIHPENIKKSLEIMYGFVPSNPLEFGMLFANGLKHIQFFEFQMFIEGIDGRSK